MKILVANPGRSASRFTADLLNRLGIPANHEFLHMPKHLRERGARPGPGIPGAVEVGWPSSYHMDDFDHIYLTLRNPLKTTFSWASRSGNDGHTPWGKNLKANSDMPDQWFTAPFRKRRAVYHMDYIFKSALAHPNFKYASTAENQEGMRELCGHIALDLDLDLPNDFDNAYNELLYVGNTRKSDPWPLSEYTKADAATIRYWMKFFGYE